MAGFTLGGITVNAPDEYAVKMVIFTAPMKQSKAAPQMFKQKERQYLRNLVIAKEDLPTGMTPSQYGDEQGKILAMQMPGYKRLKAETIKIDGVDCPLLESQGNGPDGMLVVSLNCYVPSTEDKMIYTLSASNMAGLPFAETRPEYVTIFESFKITK